MPAQRSWSSTAIRKPRRCSSASIASLAPLSSISARPAAPSKDSLNLSKEAAEGIWAVVDFVPGQSEENKRYAEAYKKEYNEDYDSLSSGPMTALKILAEAIKKAGEDRAKIREAILATQGYKGVLGTFSFTPNGDGLSEVSIVRDREGSAEAPEDRQRRVRSKRLPTYGSNSNRRLVPAWLHAGDRMHLRRDSEWIGPPIFRC